MQSLNAPGSSLTQSQTVSYILFGTGTRLSFAQACRMLTHKLTFSPAYYYKGGTIGNALKCHIISTGLSL